MDVSPVANASPKTPTATLTADFNMFLQLLTTQLQYQDPLDPMDTSEYTQQLVSYSQVEQSIQQTSRLDQILARLSGQDLAAASSYIGREVTAYQPTAALDEDGAEWFYDLKSTAATTRLTILDSYGQTVRQIDGPTSAGRHEIVWDGTNASGGQAPAGNYTLRVDALTASGQVVASSVGTRGIVSGVESLAGDIVLNLGATSIRADQIAAITAPHNAQ